MSVGGVYRESVFCRDRSDVMCISNMAGRDRDLRPELILISELAETLRTGVRHLAV